jgi:hypothetical protein
MESCIWAQSTVVTTKIGNAKCKEVEETCAPSQVCLTYRYKYNGNKGENSGVGCRNETDACNIQKSSSLKYETEYDAAVASLEDWECTSCTDDFCNTHKAMKFQRESSAVSSSLSGTAMIFAAAVSWRLA